MTSRQTIRALAREHGINEKTLQARLISGWPLDEALSAPLRQRKAYEYKLSRLTNVPFEHDLEARAWVRISVAFGGLTLEEIATLAECSVANITEIMRRAFTKLRQRSQAWRHVV